MKRSNRGKTVSPKQPDYSHSVQPDDGTSLPGLECTRASSIVMAAWAEAMGDSRIYLPQTRCFKETADFPPPHSAIVIHHLSRRDTSTHTGNQGLRYTARNLQEHRWRSRECATSNLRDRFALRCNSNSCC
jgi:hypothetical protein